jgi:hypothetical protein
VSEAFKPDDPRAAGSADRDQVVVDTTTAVLLSEVEVATVTNRSDGTQAIALVLSGRINQSQDDAKVMFLMPLDGAAGIITELIGLCAGIGRQDDLEQAMNRRIDDMAAMTEAADDAV